MRMENYEPLTIFITKITIFVLTNERGGSQWCGSATPSSFFFFFFFFFLGYSCLIKKN
jgi:hypothetical protein